MANPFIGPSHALASKPTSVQRTINLMPIPIEPGNERTAWVFKDVPGLTALTLTNNIVASFTYAVAGQVVTFTDTSAIAPTSWAWNFGDTATSTSQNPVHTYASRGVFTVTLTVSNASGRFSTTTQTINTLYAAFGFDTTNAGSFWTLSNSNRTGDFLPTLGASSSANIRAVNGHQDKRYWEFLVSTLVTDVGTLRLGMCLAAYSNNLRMGDSIGVGYIASTGQVICNGVTTTTLATYTVADTIGIALDGATGNVWFSKNGTFTGSPTGGTGSACNVGTGANMFFGVSPDVFNPDNTAHVNGTGHFTAATCTTAPPTGFLGVDD